MKSLRIPLIDILDDGLRIDVDVSVKDIQPQDVEVLPLERVAVTGVMSPISGGYLFRGYVEGFFEHPCDRCLELARSPFRSEIVWTFEEGPVPETGHALMAQDERDDEEDAADRRMYQGGEIDLTPYVWEELVLAAPVKYLCNDACAGLCPECGANLNMNRCECGGKASQGQIANSGLSGLAELFPELAPKKKEE